MEANCVGPTSELEVDPPNVVRVEESRGVSKNVSSRVLELVWYGMVSWELSALPKKATRVTLKTIANGT